MSFIVEVHYTKDGKEYTDRYADKIMEACVRKTKRKKGVTITGTTSRMRTKEDLCIPPPPADFKFAMFKIKQRKNRFGRLINDKPDQDL